MYHYVRPISGSKYPSIKGLELNGFKRQLDFLQENYTIVTSDEVNNAFLKNKILPTNACWLTFDDGFKDHIKYVMPELLSRNLSGAFFPASSSVKKSKLLNVHSIQHILCCSDDIKSIILDLNNLCKHYGYNEDQINIAYKKYAIKTNLDDADTIYVKRMLQHVLNDELKNEITTQLFKKYVGEPILEFSKNLYMNIDEIIQMRKNGMYIGSHGTEHYWLNKVSETMQRKDIKESIEFLEEIGTPTSNWIMCYPYGGYNDKTLSIVKENGASLGVTTEKGNAIIGNVNPLTLPRMDTNDFPQ